MDRTNWAGNYSYRARAVHHPSSLEQLQEVVSRASRIRVLGSRHSFTSIADSDELVSLDALPSDVSFGDGTVSFGAALRYGELSERLQAEGLALTNLASLPHTSVAGAISTATHGSGDRNGNLATSVAALELVRSDGSLLGAARGDPDFEGLVVGLGAVGAVTRITLDVEPAYEVRQRVFESLEWGALFEHFDEISAAGYSVSAFTLWGDAVDQVWIKCRDPQEPRWELFGAQPATVDHHPILGLDAVNCTPQLGVPGPWSDRLPHFRMGFTPSSGEEIQSEFHLPREHAVDAIEAVRRLGPAITPLLQVSEIRTIAADRLWMSPQYGRDTVAIHLTWQRDQGAVERVLVDLEDALAQFGARPHWGKLFLANAGSLYERRDDFVALLERLDARGAFRNEWLERHVLG